MTKTTKADEPASTAVEPKAPAAPPAAPTPVKTESSLPLISLILGIVSLATFMLFLGIPAIILGILGLKKDTANRGFSITGIITGAISTLLMILFTIFMFFLVIGSIVSGDAYNDADSGDARHDPYSQNEYDTTPRFRGDREGI